MWKKLEQVRSSRSCFSLKIILAQVISLPTKITHAQPAKGEKKFHPPENCPAPLPTTTLKKKWSIPDNQPDEE